MSYCFCDCQYIAAAIYWRLLLISSASILQGAAKQVHALADDKQPIETTPIVIVVVVVVLLQAACRMMIQYTILLSYYCSYIIFVSSY